MPLTAVFLVEVIPPDTNRARASFAGPQMLLSSTLGRRGPIDDAVIAAIDRLTAAGYQTFTRRELVAAVVEEAPYHRQAVYKALRRLVAAGDGGVGDRIEAAP